MTLCRLIKSGSLLVSWTHNQYHFDLHHLGETFVESGDNVVA